MTTINQQDLHDPMGREENVRNLRRVLGQSERERSGLTAVLFRIATVLGGVLVVLGVLNLLFALGVGGSVLMAKCLLIAGGVIVVFSQMLYRA